MPQGAQKCNVSYKSSQKVGLEPTKFGMWKCAENFIFAILYEKSIIFEYFLWQIGYKLLVKKC